MAVVLNTNFNVQSNSGVSGAYTFYIEVEEGTPNVITNQSPVSVNVYAKGNNGFSYNGFSAPTIDILINGVSIGKTNVSAISSSKQRIASKSLDVLHNEDGSKTISVAIKYSDAETSYLPKPFTSTTYNVVLTTIARASNLSLLYNSLVDGDNKEQVVSLLHYATGFFWKPVVIYKDLEIYRYSGLYGVDKTSLDTFTQAWLKAYLGNYSGTATFTILIETYADSSGSLLVGSNRASFTYTMGAIALSLYQNGSVTGVAFGKEANGEGVDFSFQKINFSNAIISGLSQLDLLWAHETITPSSFVGQTISINLTDYVGVAIVQITGDYLQTCFAFREGAHWSAKRSKMIDTRAGRNVARSFIVSDTGIEFANAYRFNTYGSSTTTDDNSNVIPYRIYGIKF